MCFFIAIWASSWYTSEGAAAFWRYRRVSDKGPSIEDGSQRILAARRSFSCSRTFQGASRQ
eukprot:7178613-Pyramimonas_sp.AAC.1